MRKRSAERHKEIEEQNFFGLPNVADLLWAYAGGSAGVDQTCLKEAAKDWVMLQFLQQILKPGPRTLLGKIVAIYIFLISATMAVWAWAFVSFHNFPVLLGTSLLAFSFGLRHAVDVDHIAAIDNVTRKLMQEGRKPVTVGLFFSAGHSTIVVLASVAVAAGAAAFKDRFEAFHTMGGVVGTLVSASFLLVIAIINIIILADVFRAFQHVKAGGRYAGDDLNLLLGGQGFLVRIFRPLFQVIGQSWHMYPLGFLFALGFDTATEIGLLGISAAEASKGLPVWSILVFPALFTVGMMLIDTSDSILMLGAYGWAFIKPIRKLYYNMTITFISVLVALAVGGIEALGLIGDKLGLEGSFWGFIGGLNDNFGVIGFFIIGIFVLAWIVSFLIYRVKRYDELEVHI